MTDLSWPFGPLPWQQESWSRLSLSLGRESMAHALLLSGASGLGKTHFSRALAALLLCHQPGAGTACGQCRSCSLLTAGSHSDLLWIQPESGSRAIKIDQVRALIDFANKTPGLGQRKVIVLSPAEAMNLNAANALLKCLEEPSHNTYLVLVSHASSSLPATVRSRCQLVLMAAPAPAAALEWLNHLTGEQTTSEALLAVAENKPLTARQLYFDDELGQRQTLQQGLDNLIAGTISGLEFPQLVADMELGQVLELFCTRLRHAIRSESIRSSGSLKRHFLLMDELLSLRRRVLHGGNPNRQLTIENSAMQMAQVLGAGQR